MARSVIQLESLLVIFRHNVCLEQAQGEAKVAEIIRA